jgi:hypothetical protein
MPVSQNEGQCEVQTSRTAGRLASRSANTVL